MWEQKHGSWHSTPVPFPLLLSHTPQTKTQKGPKGQDNCLKLCFMRYQPGKPCSELGPGKLGLRTGATERLDTKHNGGSDAPSEYAGKKRCSGQSRAEKSECFLRSFPRTSLPPANLVWHHRKKKRTPSPNKPSSLKMILIHTVVELAPIKT